MKRHSAFRQVVTLGIAVLGFIGALAPTARANGEEFFAPAKNSKIDLVYFGRIKDSQTGRSVTDSVYFLLTDKSTGLSFPFTNDKPGHFRSPDVGTAIKEIGEQVDVNGFEVTVNVAGYKRERSRRCPARRKAQSSSTSGSSRSSPAMSWQPDWGPPTGRHIPAHGSSCSEPSRCGSS